MRSALLCFVIIVVLPLLTQAQTVPVFMITSIESTITYYVKASVKITGTFDKWDASLTFTSPDVTTGVVDVKIQAASVHSGSKMEDDKLKSKDGFDPEHNPLITFHSTKIVQTGPETFDVPGTFTLRGVSKPETLVLTTTARQLLFLNQEQLILTNVFGSELIWAGDGTVERTWRRAGGTIEWLEKNSCVAGAPPACAVEVGSS